MQVRRERSMRLTHILSAFLIITVFLATTGCSETSVSLGQDFPLRVGQSASIKGEELQIKFLEVVADSRCPRGVTCIWEGEVSCMVVIKYRGSLQQMIFTEPGSTNWPPEISFKEYQIVYHVEPYPEAGVTIPVAEYQLFLRVSK
jgi:hypothetical protein